MKVTPDARSSILLFLGILVAWSVYWCVGSLAEYAFQHAGVLPSRFPEKELGYTTKQLGDLAGTGEIKSYYTGVVLFPADLVVMVLLSVSMGAGSLFWLRRVASRYALLALVLPLIYFASDLIEDCVLVRLLNHPDAINDDAVGILKNITRVKLGSIFCLIAQTAILLVVYLVTALRTASK
jgi:hypothetical protein